MLTEFQAIAWWLARSAPKAKLLPHDAEGEARVISPCAVLPEWMPCWQGATYRRMLARPVVRQGLREEGYR